MLGAGGGYDHVWVCYAMLCYGDSYGDGYVRTCSKSQTLIMALQIAPGETAPSHLRVSDTYMPPGMVTSNCSLSLKHAAWKNITCIGGIVYSTLAAIRLQLATLQGLTNLAIWCRLVACRR